MDKRLYDSVVKGDVLTFGYLFLKDKGVINQVDSPSRNTVLHLAARFGHLELASLIVNLRPDLVLSVNENLDTPLHEATREGRVEIMKLFIRVHPWSFRKLNRNGDSAASVARKMGKLDMARFLSREYRRQCIVTLDVPTTWLDAASCRGHADVLEEKLKPVQELALEKDSEGCTPLCLGAKALGLDLDPTSNIHCTTMNGRDNMLSLYNNREVTMRTANLGMRVLHLGINGDQYEAVGHLERTPNISKIFNRQNGNADTVLDLAQGCTPLRLGAKALDPTSDIHCTTMNGRDSMVSLYNNREVTMRTANLGMRVLHLGINGDQYEAVGHLERTPNISKIFNRQNGNANTVLDLVPIDMGCRHGIGPNHANASSSHQSQDPAEEQWINRLLKSIDINLAAAGLVASLTYPALINPPGGINEISGKAKNGEEAAFVVFLLANTLAFFIAIISIVIILVERKSMVKLSGICGKLTGLAMMLVVVAYMASACTILPKGPNTNWVLATLASVGFGSIVITLLGVAVWNKQKRMNALATQQLRHPHLLV